MEQHRLADETSSHETIRSAQEQIVIKTNRIRAVAESSTDIAWITNPMGLMLEESATWTTFTRQTFAQASEQGWQEALHPDDRARFIKHLQQTVATGKAQIIECRIRYAGQRYRDVHVQSIPVCDTAGQSYEWIGLGRDITSEKQDEVKINLAMQAAEIGMWDWDIQNDVLVWSDQCKALFGLAKEESISYERLLALLHPDDRESVVKAVDRIISKHEEDYNIEYRTIWPDQSVHWIDARGKGFFNEQGQAFRMIGVVLDITQRKQVEAALQNSEAKFRRLAETNVIGVMVGDLDGLITEGNAAFLNMLGYTAAEMQARQINWRTLTPAEFSHLDEVALQELQIKGVFSAYEKEYVTREDKHVPVLVAGALLEGSVLSCICFVVDLTIQKEADKQKDAFMSMASHELRTPLTSIKGNLQLAQRRLKRLMNATTGLAPEDTTALSETLMLLERALRQIGMQSRLINDLLDVSRIAANKLELSPKRCDLVAIVSETVKDLQSTAPNRTLEFMLPEHETVMIMADRDRISQVIANYITNALKYSAASEAVYAGITVGETEVRVWVRDRGPGLPEEAQKHIWERFYQVKGIQVLSGTGVGMGLGLYICQILINRHNGQVGVESQIGEGSTFWFTLPLIDIDAAP